MYQFTNETITLDQLPEYQETILTKPHPSYFKVIVINIIIFLLIVGIGITSILLLDTEIRKYTLHFIIGYSFIAILLPLVYWFSFKKRGFALRNKDIIYKSGIIAETTTIIPLNRIQHVVLDEGVFSRIFKLGKLQIYTAGGQTGHLAIAGIPIAQAKSIKEILLKQIDEVENLTAGSDEQ